MSSKPKKAHVNVSRDDVAYMRHSRFAFSRAEAESAAKCRAAARELVALSRCTHVGIDAVLSGVPEASVQAYCRRRLRAS